MLLFGYYLNFDTISAVIVLSLMGILLFANRKKIELQKIFFPLFYVVLYRTKLGLRLMDKTAEKFRELIKLIGLCFIGIGFLGMIYVSISMIYLLFSLLKAPKAASEGVALVLPFTNIPGIGYLSFWHFIISLFIIVVFHEFAHGVVARAHKLKIKSSGFGFLSVLIPILPLAFVDVDEKPLRKQKDHVQYSVFAAGPVINLIMALLILVPLPYVANPNGLAPFEDKFTEPIGISFSEVVGGYPAEESGLKEGIVINKIDNVDVKEYSDFLEYSYTIKPGQQVTLYSDSGSYDIVTGEFPDGSSDRGYFGVKGIANERRIIGGKENSAAVFYWFKGLIKWVFMLSFLVGMINLLPIFITDGGRMLDVAFKKLFKDMNKARKAYIFLASIFLTTILLALLINYGSKVLGLFV